MHACAGTAERRIAEALARGELEDLPGAGRPLDLEDDPLVPEELRIAHRILKNAGYTPPELDTLHDISQLERVVLDRNADDGANFKSLRFRKGLI